jgi:hypothetical protein
MKYIDADRLGAEIEKHIKEVKDAADRFTLNMEFVDANLSGIYDALAIIDSLQQEHSEVDLEKEQKTTEWSEEDELMRKRCIADLGYLTEYEPQYKERYDAQMEWLKSLQPQPKVEWSEEDLGHE